jgi:hypothetical protein
VPQDNGEYRGADPGDGPEGHGGEIRTEDSGAALDSFSVSDLGLPSYKRIAEKPARRPEPWHRPRKQFVRKSQWLACLRDLYANRDPSAQVNYLGLPGTDLLDLRVFHDGICAPQGRTLRFLGFHDGISAGSAEAVHLDVSLQQVKLRGLVDPTSRVLADDIKKIGSGNSVAFREAVRSAPYDVVNLDFCTGFAGDEPRSLGSIYNALNRIMAMQVARDVFNQGAAQVLHGLFLAALQCDGFAEACSAYFQASDLSSLDILTCCDGDFFYSMSIGFCLWVFGLAQSRAMNKVSLRAAFYYQVNPAGPEPDMVSMALSISPQVVAAPDPSELAVADEGRADGCEAAAQFARRFARAVNVDLKLESDEVLLATLVEESARLLADAGYDEAYYRQWVSRFSS